MKWKNKKRGMFFTELLKAKVNLQRYGLSPAVAGAEILKRATVCNRNALILSARGMKVSLKPKIDEKSPLRDCAFNGFKPAVEQYVQPEIFSECVSEYKSVGDIFQFEFNGVISTTLYGCELRSKNQGCKFCRSAAYTGYNFSPEEFKDALILIRTNFEPLLVINAGTIVDEFSGYGLISPYVKAARESGVASIDVEICPPKNAKKIRQLIDWMRQDGITAAQFNIEIFDSVLRLLYMPFKGTIPMENYLEMIRYAASVFGVGKVSSVILLGFEDIKSVMRGVESILDADGIPSAEIVRLLPGTELENMQPGFSVEEIVEIGREIAEKVKKKFGDAIWQRMEGCMRCGGCPLLSDVLKKL